MYQFSIGQDLNAGANNFDLRFDTRSTATDGTPIRFTVDSTSIGQLSSGSTVVSSPTLNGSAISSYMYIRKPGVDTVSKTYIANPQIEVV